MTPLIYVLAFVAVVLLVQALSSIVFSSSDRTRRVNRRLALLDSGMNPADVYKTLLRRPASIDLGTPYLTGLYDRVSIFCRQANLPISLPRLVAIVAGGAIAIWSINLALTGIGGTPSLSLNSIVSLLASFALSVLIAWVWVNRRRDARLKMLEEQMPVALDVINRALHAGHPAIAAVQLAALEMGDPIGSEFGLIVDETTYGYEFKDALANFARRTGSRDADFFAVSVGIQSETGGNLAEILGGLAKVIRARATLGKRVRALASEGRASALLLSVLPLGLISAFALLQPTFYTSKFSDPIFWPAVGVVCAVYLLGWVMIHRIINFKY